MKIQITTDEANEIVTSSGVSSDHPNFHMAVISVMVIVESMQNLGYRIARPLKDTDDNPDNVVSITK